MEQFPDFTIERYCDELLTELIQNDSRVNFNDFCTKRGIKDTEDENRIKVLLEGLVGFGGADGIWVAGLITTGRAFVYSKDSFVHRREKKYLEFALLKTQQENAAYQKKWGNKMPLLTILIGIINICTTIMIAHYVNQRNKPIINNITVKVDSTIIAGKIPYQQPHGNSDTTKKDTNQQAR